MGEALEDSELHVGRGPDMRGAAVGFAREPSHSARRSRVELPRPRGFVTDSEIPLCQAERRALCPAPICDGDSEGPFIRQPCSESFMRNDSSIYY